MRFLRFKKLISLSQTKYIRYALGEVFFVVIGILLALQVNNLNEQRKTRVQEKNVLLALHNEISNNLISLETSLKEKRTILEVNKKLLENTFPGSNWKSESKLDSLMYYFTVSGWIYVADNGVLNEIVNSGKLSSLEDNNIKNLIASVPQQIAQIVEEDRLYREDLHQYFIPYLSKNFALKNITKYRELYSYNKSSLGKSNFDVNPYKILGDIEFENILTVQAIWIKFSIEICENLKIKYLEIQSLIENKYPEIDYSELKDSLEKGFWG